MFAITPWIGCKVWALSSVRYSITPFGSVHYSITQFGSVRYSITPFGSVRYSITPFGSVRYSITPLGSVCYTITPLGSVHCIWFYLVGLLVAIWQWRIYKIFKIDKKLWLYQIVKELTQVFCLSSTSYWCCYKSETLLRTDNSLRSHLYL